MVIVLSMLSRVTFGEQNFNAHDSSQLMCERRGFKGHVTYRRGVDLNDGRVCAGGWRDVSRAGLWVYGWRVDSGGGV